MTYNPSNPPSSLQPDLQRYLIQELRRIATSLTQVEGGDSPGGGGGGGLLGYASMFDTNRDEPGNISGTLIRQQTFNQVGTAAPLGIVQDLTNNVMRVSASGVYMLTVYSRLFHSLSAVADRSMRVQVMINELLEDEIAELEDGRRLSGLSQKFFQCAINDSFTQGSFSQVLDLLPGDEVSIHYGGSGSDTYAGVSYQQCIYNLMRFDGSAPPAIDPTHTLTMAQGSGNNFGWVVGSYGDIDTRVMEGFTEPLAQIRLDTDTKIFRIQWNITGGQPQVLGLRLLFEGGIIECPRLTPTSNGFENLAPLPFEAAWIAKIGLSFPIRIEVIT